MKYAIALLAALAAPLAVARLIGIVPAGVNGNGRIELHDESGPCVASARRADYFSANGDRTPGCWVTDGILVSVVFFDGDAVQFPVTVVRQPTKA